MNASIKRINPFHFHSLKSFKYKDKEIHFHAEWKLVFAYLASLHNKYHGNLILNPSLLDKVLGLDTGTRLDASNTFEVFLRLGILVEKARLFDSTYQLVDVPHDKLEENALTKGAK